MSQPIVIYSCEELPPQWERSIVLIGPSPAAGATSWREEAINILRELGYDGVVFAPERRPGDQTIRPYQEVVEWGTQCLNFADSIIVWVPRDADNLALTTNVDFGAWQDSGKVAFGAPEGAMKTRYLEHFARELGNPTATTLRATIEGALERMGEGALRTAGEREVPLFIWKTSHFQQWYENLLAAGNVLEHARVVWSHRVGPQRAIPFFWALHVKIFITAEGRSKTNEVVIARPDISTIMLYHRGAQPQDTVIVLVREFRSPGSNSTGSVWELAGGSSFKGGASPLKLAADECKEETGLDIEVGRFRRFEARQLAATVSAHRAHLFAVEITASELAILRESAGVPLGVEADSERTYIELRTLNEILRGDFVDWSMLGQIMRVLMYEKII